MLHQLLLMQYTHEAQQRNIAMPQMSLGEVLEVLVLVEIKASHLMLMFWKQ